MPSFSSRLRPRPSPGSTSPVEPARTLGALQRFPFVIAALIAIVLAAFVLTGVAREQAGAGSISAPWSTPPHADERVPAAPSRGAMGRPTGLAG